MDFLMTYCNIKLNFKQRHPGVFLLTVGCMIFINVNSLESSRLKRAIMMSMSTNANADCLDLTITEKNLTSRVILTGTVTTCGTINSGLYKCTLQVWRVMKGNNLVSDLTVKGNSTFKNPFYKKMYINVYGMGNPQYCESNVKDHDTRVFFLNRSNNRLVLSASLLRITLSNLENTQAVIEGRKIKETPKKPIDPCINVLCGFGARCVSAKGSAMCVCPPALCSSSGKEDDIVAPVCGSDGVTYPNSCRLRAAQCLEQKKIQVVYETKCEPDCSDKDRGSKACTISTTIAPVIDPGPCDDVVCDNSAVCVVQIGHDGSRTSSCACPTCDDVSTQPVCGSDQRSHKSICDMNRMACIEGLNITVVRNATCNPCEVFNETTNSFEMNCIGTCAIDKLGNPYCCDSIPCTGNNQSLVCGSDGNTYESECAMNRYACKIARNLTVVRRSSCPLKKPMTMVTGSLSIKSDNNCPGNCNPENKNFKKFIKKFEATVNENLKLQALTDIDSREMGEFQVTEVREGSAILLFKIYASTSSQPITIDEDPNDAISWMYNRLYDFDTGALVVSARMFGLSLAARRNPRDDFIVEDVCLQLQCQNGAACLISTSGSGARPDITPSCSCNNIGEIDSLSVTLACKKASDGVASNLILVNHNAARRAMCHSKSQLTFIDACSETATNPCENLGGCRGPGEVCLLTNGRATCECITCGNMSQPVCTFGGLTFRSPCDLQRHNCLTGDNLIFQSFGACESESQCNDVKCWHGAQCEEVAQGTVCVCPSNCINDYAPVCGSDCVTYDNECKMTVAACENKADIKFIYAGPCDEVDQCSETSGDYGSGDPCGCQFGATCDNTFDDEDTKCICSFSCPATLTTKVCASDGQTYANECEVRRAQCEQQKVIFVEANGPCKESCQQTRYGCCRDGITTAKGFKGGGCPEICQCNEFGSFGNFCNPITRQCVCRPGVGGLRCDRCKPGFWNFRALAEQQITGCMACRCHADGSTRDDCDQMTGKCNCKLGVKGNKCTECSKDGSWVTSSVCDSAGLSPESASSCKDLSCRAGQECVKDSDTLEYVCRCPSLTACDDFNGGRVCGTNGITYADFCQMRVMTCKQGVDVSVAAEMTCEEMMANLNNSPALRSSSSPNFQTSSRHDVVSSSSSQTTAYVEQSSTTLTPKTETEIIRKPESTSQSEPNINPEEESKITTVKSQLEITQEEEATSAPITSAEPETSVSTSLSQSTSLPVDENESSGSGCRYGDDEDCMGSGEEDFGKTSSKVATTMSTHTSTTIINEPSKTDSSETTYSATLLSTTSKSSEKAVILNGKATFKYVNGTTLSFTPELEDTSSENFQQYSNLIQEKIMEYVQDPLLGRKVQAVRITSFEDPASESFWGNWIINQGVTVNFEIHLAPGTLGEEVEKALNSVSNNVNDFVISKPAELDDMTLQDRPFIPVIDDYERKIKAEEDTLMTKSYYGGSETPTVNNTAAYVEGNNFSIPQFGGASYAAFPTVDAFRSITIEMYFRTFDSEGLLIFAAQAISSTSLTSFDFVSLAVKGGKVEFRYNTGSGPLILRSKSLVNDSNWHKIVAHRNTRDGMLKLDKDLAVQGSSPRGTSGLNIGTMLFVGGVEDNRWVSVKDRVEVSKGLTGCVKSLSIQHIRYIIADEPSSTCQTRYRLAECSSSPCFPNPCKNSADCFITQQQQHVFTNKCQCKNGFEGKYCAQETTKQQNGGCSLKKCHSTAKCRVTPSGDGIHCECPSNRSGSLCENIVSDTKQMDVPTYMPAFAQDSYMEMKTLGKSVKLRMNIEVAFYSSQPDGLIFYNGQTKSGAGDFVALNIVDQQLVFMYSLGSGMVKIRSKTKILLNSWHEVRVSRDKRYGYIAVDGEVPVAGESPNDHTKLDVNQPLYLGGLPNFSKVPPNSGITAGLTGALQKFTVNGLNVPLGSSIDDYNVQPFNAHACYHQPCMNGVCVPHLNQYSCSCLEGWTGKNCDKNETLNTDMQQVQEASGIYFDGNTKVMYRNAIKTGSPAVSHNLYELQVTTMAGHGLLLMTGKDTASDKSSDDYLAVAITNGRIYIQYDLGSGPAHILSTERIDNGKLTYIKIERIHKKASLQINNGLVQYIEAPGRSSELNTDGFIWLGGTEYKPHGIGLYKSLFDPFIGCVTSFYIHDQPINLEEDALNSPALVACS